MHDYCLMAEAGAVIEHGSHVSSLQVFWIVDLVAEPANNLHIVNAPHLHLMGFVKIIRFGGFCCIFNYLIFF